MSQPQTASALDLHERDKALADAVKRKDRKATAEFVQQYADAVYGYVAARLRPNTADAEDLTQDVFLAACRSIGEYRAAATLRAWMLGIARHKVEDYYRARLREEELEEPDAGVAEDAGLDSTLDQRQQQERVLTTMDRLPEQYRLLLKWRYWDQKKTDEIAAGLGRTAKSVERMLARARERFRREWEATR
jgi:RNA polymerase sigma-70 factor (ECF subfamily)